MVLSHSRAGLIWGADRDRRLYFLYQIYLRSWRRAFLIGLWFTVILVAVLAVAMQMSDRFSTLFGDYSSLTRLEVYKHIVAGAMDNPWLGYGLNGFEPEYRLYQQNVPETFNHAHSDILESLVDLGFIGGLPYGPRLP